MFRMLKLQPPHGWRAVLWELGIVTLGVLIALAAQQWVESLSWRSKTRVAIAAVRGEVGDHYASAVEWRMVHPCLHAQIEALQQRLIDSGDTLNPAPIYREAAFTSYVLRLPSREMSESAWQAAIADGVTAHLSPTLRKELSDHYVQTASIALMTDRNDQDVQRVFTMSRPVKLDASGRLELMQELDELRGRIDYMDLNSGQVLDHLDKVRMVPHATVVQAFLERSGTRQLCNRQGLPLRSFNEATTPIDYFYSPQQLPGVGSQHPNGERR